MRCKNLLSLLTAFTPFIFILHDGPETIESWPNGYRNTSKNKSKW